ncbi:uncharacterized protein LOC124426821 [Vespa crabro]|uniref:uncharacterized protein LOC124426821 n=1 Tax=Vespa crabro TaxID=7445 RepID=UPI001F028AF5|nr:uncharacterized protein LOC124426821 [Vespa crabro]XP_046824920.1 uncharacterized protein LOC124426821 [Vespa crabro]XP_046824921.1 uncharacterized protein LOC124426821 [Vespa crabro]
MVMAGNEGAPGSLAEDSLSARLQWLRQRREALQEKLALKNTELKNLCIEEAELTGVLPPEIPLEPGESPPTFRKKVGTAFTYPQNLINKLKSNEAEESALELERQVQIGIVEAALGIVNDPAESKAVRRKHRLVYQQGQRRLQELEARLNSIRQSRNKTHRTGQYQHTMACNTQSHLQSNVKHRTKKPRPPLDSTGNESCLVSTRAITQEENVNLNLIGTEQKYPGYEEHLPFTNVYHHTHDTGFSSTSPIDQRQNIKASENDFNENHNIYILPDQYRTRTYSHGSGGTRNQNHYQDNNRVYRTVPNTYSEEERQIRYRQFQQQQQKQHELQEDFYNHQQYAEYKQFDSEVQRKSNQLYYDREFRSSHHVHTPEYQIHYKNQSQPWQRKDRDMSTNRNLRSMGPPVDSHMPPGCWMRYDEEIIWCPDEQLVSDRFGSLDRRKRNGVQHVGNINAETQSRYRTVTIGGSKNSVPVVSYPQPTIHLLPLSEQTQVNNKILLRTQSLGSVETWHSNRSQESQDDKDTTDNVSRKGKEKEWYETSLDSGTSPALEPSLLITHKAMHCQSSSPVSCVKDIGVINIVNDTAKNIHSNLQGRCKLDTSIQPQSHLQPIPIRYEHRRPKVLEIPAESRKIQENNDEAILIRSPHNCTIVQAGKYQPYREVTKPFEMSDFYKYSTKFRKRNEISGQTSSNENCLDSYVGDLAGSTDVQKESNSSNYVHNGNLTSPVQKKIYQPVERMTCQPYLTSLR